MTLHRRSMLLIGCLIPLCWLWMMAVHEFGHVLGAWLTGGRVQRVVIHPLVISRTDVQPNPYPGIVVWAGPLTGVVVPVISWLIFRTLRIREAFLIRFFAGFCLVSNGCYIGAGSFHRVGDAGDMLRSGSPVWLLWLFGLSATGCGFALWNGESRHFGLDRAAGNAEQRTSVELRIVMITAILLALTITMLIVRQME